MTEKLGQSCYFYIPKIDFLEEAIFWGEMLSFLELSLGVPKNSFKVTVIVESVTALIQLDEIIFALRERIVGLNAGKWNYLSSVVKRSRNLYSSLIDPRNQIKPDAPLLKAFYLHVVHTAHRRGIHAIGGASNYLPKMN